MKKTVAIHNLGCKVNSYEAGRMAEKLEKAGFRLVEFNERADVYLVNTCTVTAIADKKSRQLLHRARELNPDALIVAAGCYVETGSEALSKEHTADLLIPNGQKEEIAELVTRALEEREGAGEKAAPVSVTIPDTVTANPRVRAFLKVQEGCSRYCTYCIIPHARGPAMERPFEESIKEAEEMAGRGFKEIVPTGIHISSLGPEKLGRLLLAMDRIPGLERIRLSSLEPGIISPEFVYILKKVKGLCPHFHLSLQSGCDATLKRMNRHYTAAGFREAVRLLREAFEDPAITTDVIAGFPGETEEEFEESLAFCKEIAFYRIHIFPYSRRTGTPAAKMPGQLSNAVKKERCKKLSLLEKQQELDFLSLWPGREVRVLWEEIRTVKGRECLLGHTPEYLPAALPLEEIQGSRPLPGDISRVTGMEILEKEGILLVNCTENGNN